MKWASSTNASATAKANQKQGKRGFSKTRDELLSLVASKPRKASLLAGLADKTD